MVNDASGSMSKGAASAVSDYCEMYYLSVLRLAALRNIMLRDMDFWYVLWNIV